MSKRTADTELNQDNWDEEVKPNNAGSFQRADKSALAERKILSARSNRSIKSGTAGIFKSFTGLSEKSFSSIASFNFVPTDERKTKTPNSPAMKTEYLSHLQVLNQNLVDWITKHINNDPYCILSPVFVDYNKHLQSLNDKFKDFTSSSENRQINNSLGTCNKETGLFPPINGSSVPSFSFGSNSATSHDVSLPSLFSTTATINKPTFTFGFSQATSTSQNLQLPTLSQSNQLPPSAANLSTVVADEDDEVYVPPKPEVKEIKEEGAVYTARCKLFYNSSNEWYERGVGNLFIKPMSKDKFQLLIRADTNLGNILLNILITKDIPMKLQKNNVTFACVPSPPLPVHLKSSTTDEDDNSAHNKPYPMLIRVKTAELAEELMQQINEHRGYLNAN